MKKRILAVVAAAVMVISSTVMTFADTTTGLIGQFNFDGNLKNEVTGTESVMTAGKVTEEAGDAKMEYSNGVSDNAAYFNGVFTNYGVEIMDGVPKTNTFTLSYDIFYVGYSQHTPTINLATDWGSANAGTAIDQWASFGWGWQGNMSFAAGIWIHDQANKNPQEWIDFWQTGGTPDLLNAEGTWAAWKNITYAVDAGVVTVYVDGEKIDAVAAGSIAADTPIINTVTEATRLFIGVNAWDTPLAAAIDNLYIYDRALTADDVKELIGGRDYDAASAPEVEQPETTTNKGALADKNNADYLQPAETTAATEDGGSNMGLYIGIGAAVVVVIVIVVVVAVVAGKKKSNDDDDDEE